MRYLFYRGALIDRRQIKVKEMKINRRRIYKTIGTCLLVAVLSVIPSIPVHIYVKKIKNEEGEVAALRALSTALSYNPISNHYKIHYSDIYSDDTVLEYNRSTGVLYPRGSRLGPRRSDECRDEFYFTKVSVFDIYNAADNKRNFQDLCGQHGCIKHESYPFCA